jgi:transmembrane 9 superfamily member 2/4
MFAAVPLIAVCWYFLSKSLITVLFNTSRSPHHSSTPRSYHVVEPVDIKFNYLFSTRTQLSRDYARLPFCYSHSHGPLLNSLGFIPDDDSAKSVFLQVVPELNYHQVTRRDASQKGPASYHYEVYMRGKLMCDTLCEEAYYDQESVNELRWLIENEYFHNWVVDDMPSSFMRTVTYEGRDEVRNMFGRGFPVGFVDPQDNMPYIYNYVKFRLFYHRVSATLQHIVGFAVEPMSVRHEVPQGRTGHYGNSTRATPQRRVFSRTCFPGKSQSQEEIVRPQVVQLGEQILYTYDVTWEEVNVPWSKRWDAYLSNGHRDWPGVRYVQAINTIVLVILCSVWFWFVMIRNHRRNRSADGGIAMADDTRKKGDEKERSTTDDAGDDRASIHRTDTQELQPPANLMLYCALVGSGLQLFLVVLSFLALAALGAASQARPASLMSLALLLFCFTGTAAGFGSSRLYCALRKQVHHRHPHQCTALTAVLFPGISFLLYVAYNMALWANGSAIAVPRGQVLLRVCAMWWFVHIPLVYVGSYLGYSSQAGVLKQRTPYEMSPNTFSKGSVIFLACLFPPVTAYVDNFLQSIRLSIAVTLAGLFFVMRRSLCRPTENVLRKNGSAIRNVSYVLLAGIFPFLCSYVEIYFTLPVLWMDRYNDAYMPALCVFLLASLICAAWAMALARRQLVQGNGWCWTAFFGSGGGVALYTFLYSAYWFHSFLKPAPLVVTHLLYYGTMLWVCFSLLLIFGSIGTAACLWLFCQRK